MDYLLEAYKDKGIVRWRKVPAPPKEAGNLQEYMGEALREFRQQRNMVQRDFTGISLGYVSEVERGKNLASSEILESMCSDMNVKLSELLRATADKLEKVGK